MCLFDFIRFYFCSRLTLLYQIRAHIDMIDSQLYLGGWEGERGVDLRISFYWICLGRGEPERGSEATELGVGVGWGVPPPTVGSFCK